MSPRFVGSIVLLLPLGTGVAPGQEVDFLERDLRAGGIEPTDEAIVAYLEAVRSSDERRRQIARDVANLRSPDFQARRAATQSLIRTPQLPQTLLEGLTKDQDPEVRRRAKRILAKAELSTQRSRIVAVLTWTARERPDGVCPLLLDLVDQWGSEPYLQYLFARAIAATARPEDADALRAYVDSEVPEARVASLMGLAGLGETEPLRARIDDPDERVQLAVRTALVSAGDRDVLPMLVDLLESENLDVRNSAARRLRFTTGKQFAFAAYDEPEIRQRAVDRWRGWIRANAATHELRLPIPHRHDVRLGRTLIGLHNERKLREVDENGNTLWEAGGFTYLWGCHGLPNGHRLAVDYTNKYVVEFDAFGRKVWIATDLPGKPTNVQRLDDGNTLLTLAEPGLLVELSPEKEVVWRLEVEGRPTTAQRLDDGRTLVCLQFGRRVVEFDRNGEVLWEITGLRRPHTAQRLDNGNTLVCEMDPGGRVVEFAPDKSVVWEKQKVGNPAQAQRLANGDTMISGDGGVVVYDRAGKVVRQVKVSRSRFYAY